MLSNDHKINISTKAAQNYSADIKIYAHQKPLIENSILMICDFRLVSFDFRHDIRTYLLNN